MFVGYWDGGYAPNPAAAGRDNSGRSLQQAIL
jgi:hypothetical protein